MSPELAASIVSPELAAGAGALTAGFIGETEISGINAGRNNPIAVYSGLQTRLNNGNISRFSLRYATKAGVASATKDINSQAVETFIQTVYDAQTQSVR